MEAPLNELAKLERLTAAGGKPPSIADSLDSLLFSLQEVKIRLSEVAADEITLRSLVQSVGSRKKEVDERQKEVYSSVSRLGKALDKVGRLYHPQKSALTSIGRNFQLFYQLTLTSLNLLLLWPLFRRPLLCISYGLGNSKQPKSFYKFVDNVPDD